MSRYKRASRKKTIRPLWPIVGVTLGLVLLVGAGWALLGQNPKAALEVTGRPSLKVDPTTIDLGNQTLGNTVQAEFRLTNVGDQPLRFTEAPYIEVVEGC